MVDITIMFKVIIILSTYFFIQLTDLWAQQGGYGVTGLLYSVVRLPYELGDNLSSKRHYNKLSPVSLSCDAWGEINESCSCQNVCPLDSSLFLINSYQFKPEVENSLVDRNHSYDYPLGDYWGHCWGHATLTQRLTRLAIFRPDENVPYLEGSKSWVKFYKKIIKDISRNRAQVVPGFANIHQFSQHPLLRNIFRNSLSRLWFDKSVTLLGLGQTSSGHYTKRSRLRFVERVRERINMNQTPLVVANAPIPLVGPFLDSHVLVAWKIYENEMGNTVICYRDSNLAPEKNADCFAHDIISPQGAVLKYWWLSNKSIAYHEDSDTYKQLKSLQQLCQKLMCQN